MIATPTAGTASYPLLPCVFFNLEANKNGGIVMANCETCKIKTSAPENVPYIVHESALARMERMVKRLWIAVLVLIFLLVGTNGAWLWYESQFEEITTTTYEADATDGGNAVINGDGSVNINGESESHND